MWKYVTKRLISFLPTLIVVVLILFVLKSALPGDPVDDYLAFFSESSDQNVQYKSDYEKIATKMGFASAPFYVTIHPRSYPENIYSILPLSKRKKLQNEILAKGFSWPRLAFHGTENQFHVWVKNIFSGNFGISILDGKDVGQKISASLKWTFLMMLISLILSIGLSIPLGVWIASPKRNILKTIYEKISFLFYTIPLFWLCVLAVIFLTSDYYGIKIFPSVDVDPRLSKLGFWDSVGAYGTKLILPAICWTLHSLTYATSQLKSSIRHQNSLSYVKTALAKGLSGKQISTRHVLKNALLPMITLFMAAIPGALAGSLVIETIFNIPGMGRLLINAILAVDWNVVVAVVFTSAIITMLSYLLADLMYAWSNPKIKFVVDE